MALREFTWCLDAGGSRTTDFVVSAIAFGDGYEQVSSTGINTARETASYSVSDKISVVNAAYNFLRDHRGVEPFILDVGGEVRTYRTVGEIVRTHVKADRWQVSFNVKQVFIP